MKFYRVLGFVIACVVFGAPEAQAAVVISEIAWMGSAVSANDEWIELKNTSDLPIDVTDWVLVSSEDLLVLLSGELAAGSYAVLERTDDDSAPGAAFLIYTGALSNSGTTLTLRDGDGAIMDQVAGGENWESVGGDNTTKETAQLTESGWVTAGATPGADNKSVTTQSEPDEAGETGANDTDASNDTVTKNTSGGGSNKTQLQRPDYDLRLSIEGPSQVYVNQPVFFEAQAAGLGPVHLDSLKYQWNFGDMHTAKKKQPTHSYRYPGSYVVVLDAGYASHHGVERHEITVLPVSFSVTRNERGDVQIHNDAPYEVDLSEYVIRVGADRMVLPPRTILLAKSTITIPARQFEDEALWAALYDRQTQQVASTFDQALTLAREVSDTPTPAVVTAPLLPVAASEQSPPAVLETSPEVLGSEQRVLGTSTKRDSVALNATGTPVTNFSVPATTDPAQQYPWWYFALVGLLGIAIMAIFWRPHGR